MGVNIKSVTNTEQLQLDVTRNMEDNVSHKNECPFCNKICFSQIRYHAHLATHTGQHDYFCNVCKKSFARVSSLTRHMGHHAQDRAFKCDLCPRSFYELCHLKRHNNRSHSGKGKFVCDLCGKSFTEQGLLNRHKHVHSSLTSNTIEQNMLSFASAKTKTNSSTSAKQRMLNAQVTARNDLKCDLDEIKQEQIKEIGIPESVIKNEITSDETKYQNEAGVKFDLCTSLQTYMKREEISESMCGEIASRHSDTNQIALGMKDEVADFLSPHLFTASTFEDVKQEDVLLESDMNEIKRKETSTLKIQPRETDLTQTVEVIDASDPQDIKIEVVDSSLVKLDISCDTCGKEFKTKQGLRRHSKAHQEQAGKVCTVCGKRFRSINFDMSRHMRTHTQEKNYACCLCEKRFSESYLLKVHARKHVGEERPFQCYICGKSFPRQSLVNKHISRVHLAVKRYQCSVCWKAFLEPNGLRRHSKTHKTTN
eukprot:GHVU01004137.1.p1 GENE.GHVU01004137.1~~GHVU01004137.1.p1  ORF type:complete len:481 (-),score=38.91 GHVU01004137.1:51-1493(-)